MNSTIRFFSKVLRFIQLDNPTRLAYLRRPAKDFTHRSPLTFRRTVSLVLDLARQSAAGQWAGLRTIAVLNAAYAGLSLVLAFQHRAALTELGVAYLILEVLIVGSLALVEWRVARRPPDPEP